MSYSQSNSYFNNHVADDDLSTVFDADTVVPDEEVPSLPPLPPSPSAVTTENSNQAISSTSCHESPVTTISGLLRRINSRTRHRPDVPSSITTATKTTTASSSKEISINHHQSVSSSSSSNRLNTNSSPPQKTATATTSIDSSVHHSSRTQPRQSSRLQQLQLNLQDQSSAVETPDSSEDEDDDDDDEPNKINEEAVTNQFFSSSSSRRTTRTSTTRSTTMFANGEATWRMKFEKLCAYKELHGDTNVPSNSKDHNKELGVWVSCQRHHYKMFQKKTNEKKASITAERIQMLNSIGFQWVGKSKPHRKESEWNKRFTELSEYKEKYGVANVQISDNKQLGVWVCHQRREYKKFIKNGKAQITKERIQMLESIGFDFFQKLAPKYKSKWNEQFTELSAYKEKYGHTIVPQSNKQLGSWVKRQRYDYRKFQKSGKGPINLERINMLNSIGFQWEVCPGRPACS